MITTGAFTPPLAWQSVSDAPRALGAPRPRFGKDADSGAEGMDGADSLNKVFPDIAAPSVCEEDVEAQAAKITLKDGFFNAVGQFARWRWMAWQASRGEKKADQYLPPSVKTAIRRYKWSQAYWRDKCFGAPGACERMIITLKGPPAIKAMQARVESTRGALEKLRAMDTFLQNVVGDNILSKGIRWMGQREIRRKERIMTLYGPLLDQVPALPMRDYEPVLKRLQAVFNQKRPQDPIQQIDRTLGVGSIAQVFLATTTHGERVVIKARRPDAAPPAIEALRDFLYYQALTQVKDKAAAMRETNATIRVLQDEVQLEGEQDKARRVESWLQKNGSDLRVPTVFASCEDGIVQSYAGERTLNQVDAQQPQLKQTLLKRIAPDLIMMSLLSPDKYLDFHGGNLILSDVADESSAPSASLIDFGRMARLHETRQSSWLALMRAVYSQPDLKSAACDDAVTAALSPLLENGQAQKMDVVKRYQLLQFVFDDMLDAWVQAAQWSHHSQGRDEPLKPLCQQALSREDARNVHAKLTNLMRGYFLAPPEADAESDPQRALADPATFLKIFDQCVYEKTQWRQSDSLFKHNTTLPTLLSIEKALPGFDDVLRAAMAGDAAAYRQQLDALCQDPAKRARWAMMTCVNRRINDLATRLATAWPGKATNAQEAAHFKRNLGHYLRQTFGLNKPQEYLPAGREKIAAAAAS